MTTGERELTERITAYLTGGGLFNPELANHDAVRDLLIDCREALQAAIAAQPAQRPFAWCVPKYRASTTFIYGAERPDSDLDWRPLYLAAQPERADDLLRLRKIAAHVPAMVYLAAKEAAGYGVQVRANAAQPERAREPADQVACPRCNGSGEIPRADSVPPVAVCTHAWVCDAKGMRCAIACGLPRAAPVALPDGEGT